MGRLSTRITRRKGAFVAVQESFLTSIYCCVLIFSVLWNVVVVGVATVRGRFVCKEQRNEFQTRILSRMVKNVEKRKRS